jgi:DNA-binding HxlR family transcriptional regulator
VRHYGQHCALAKTLDLVGDRWTLLIVRELSIRPCRYTDLRDGLPGIATNLLADRLKTLEAAGIVASETAPPPVATTLYRLDQRGRELMPAIAALARWGAPLMAERAPEDAFRPRWLVPAIRAMYGTVDAGDLGTFTVLLDLDAEPVTLSVADGHVEADLGAVAEPDLRVTGVTDAAFQLLTGADGLDDLVASGALDTEGDPRARDALRTLVSRVPPLGAAPDA